MELSILPWKEGKNSLRRANLENLRPHKTQNYQLYAQPGVDMMQSVEADPSPAKGEIMSLTQKEPRHLKGLRLTSGKRSCVVKGSNKPVRTTAWRRDGSGSWGKAALDHADAPTWPRALVGPQIIPIKEKLVRIDKLDFSLKKMNPTLTKGERAFINGQKLLKGETRMMTTSRQKTKLMPRNPNLAFKNLRAGQITLAKKRIPRSG
jgi:hypothetical protein